MHMKLGKDMIDGNESELLICNSDITNNMNKILLNFYMAEN